MTNLNYLKRQTSDINQLIELYLKKSIPVGDIKDWVEGIFEDLDKLLEHLWSTPEELLDRLESDLNLLQYHVDNNINDYIKEMSMRNLDLYMKKIQKCLNDIYPILCDYKRLKDL